LRRPQITSTLPRIPPHEGAFRDRHERGGGERWPRRLAGVFTPTNELIRLREDCDGMVPGLSHRFSHEAFADGQAVWSWRPDAGAKCAMMRSASRG
jgi:hypothetical protein